VNLLAIDTCDARGSVAALRDGKVVEVCTHESAEDYSSWLLPAVGRILGAAGWKSEDVDVYAVAAGPGSFTGLRVGLTTVKAWGEGHERPIAAVSRLEAIAAHAREEAKYVAAFADAHRGQVFGALYRKETGKLRLVEEELVMAPGRFVEWVAEQAKNDQVEWLSPDAAAIEPEAAWVARAGRGERIQGVSAVLAPMIGKLGFERARANQLTNALALDANYVRRCDAEMFWKDGAANAR